MHFRVNIMICDSYQNVVVFDGCPEVSTKSVNKKVRFRVGSFTGRHIFITKQCFYVLFEEETVQ